MKKQKLFAVVVGLLVAGMMALFVACPDGDKLGKTPPLPKMEDLKKAIDEANELFDVLIGVVPGTLPIEVSSDYYFVIQALYDTLEGALNDANAMYDEGSANGVQIKAMITKLNAARTAADNAKVKGTKTPDPTDYSELRTLIDDAQTLLDSVAKSANGADVASDKYWVTPALHDALKDKIEAAEAMVAVNEATQPQVTAMIRELGDAKTTVETEKNLGLLASDADYLALQNAITAAALVFADVVSAENGSEIPSDTYWVTPTLYNALSGAIDDAETMYKGKDTLRVAKTQVTAMITRLETAADAVTAGQQLGQTTPEPGDFNALRTAISAAQEVLNGVVSDDNGEDVPSDTYWVTPALYNALENAIDEANGLLETENTGTPATKGPIDRAINALDAAKKEVEDNRELGTRFDPPNVDAIEALLDSIDGLIAGVVIEPEVNNIPGLFLDFGVQWVTQTAANALETERTAAQAFVANSGHTGTQEQADVIEAALQEAIDAYVPAEGLGLVFVDVPTNNAGTNYTYQAYQGGASLTTTADTVTLTTPYRMSKYEITVGQWEAVWETDENGDWGGGDKWYTRNSPTATGDRAKFPASRISWYDAIAFCNKLSARLGKTPVYQINNTTALGTGGTDAEKMAAWKALTLLDIPRLMINEESTRNSGVNSNGNANTNTTWNQAAEGSRWQTDGFRLPTEIEWRWAAMGADKGGYAGKDVATWGYRKSYAGQDMTGITATTGIQYNNRNDYAWLGMTNSNATTSVRTTIDGTRPVGTKLANELGIFDMSGNVAEWCFAAVTATSGTNNMDTDGQGATRGGTQTSNRGANSNVDRKIAAGGDWENPSDANTATLTAVKDRPSVWNRTGIFASIGYTQTGIRLVQTTGSSGSIDIGFDPDDPAKIAKSGDDTLLLHRSNSSITFTAAPGSNEYRWYLNAVEQVGASNAFTVTGTDAGLYIGTNTVRVAVTKGGKTYSYTVTFTATL